MVNILSVVVLLIAIAMPTVLGLTCYIGYNDNNTVVCSQPDPRCLRYVKDTTTYVYNCCDLSQCQSLADYSKNSSSVMNVMYCSTDLCNGDGTPDVPGTNKLNSSGTAIVLSVLSIITVSITNYL